MEHKLTGMGFSAWLETREERLGEYMDAVLSALGLEEEGASTPLSSLDRKSMVSKIRALDAYQNLPSRRRESADSAMEGDTGSVLDVVKAMAGYLPT